jgi:hypothetical protein
MAERPTALEITEAHGLITRFGGFEQLAAAYLFVQPLTSANPGLVTPTVPATQLGSGPGCLGESGTPRTWLLVRIQQIWFAWPECRP